MADPFGVIGIVSLAIQITQIAVQLGMDWKDAPNNVKTFMAELRTLRTVLSETNTNIILNPDFAAAFQNQPSLLLSQLGPNAPLTTDTNLLVETCRRELATLLKELQKRVQGHRLGWERLKGAFLAKDTRESVENLYRQCQALNNMLSIDAIVLAATTYNEVKEARKEQQEWHQAESEIALAIKDGVSQSHQRQENQERQHERQGILNWLTPIDYAPQQHDFLGRRQAGTGRWLLGSTEFRAWLQNGKTLFCPGMPGAGKTILTSIVVEELNTIFQTDTSVGIAYIYCNFNRSHEQKLEDLLRSLLKQLTQGQLLTPEPVKSLYDQQKVKGSPPSLDEISNALQLVTTSFSKVFIIVDALDECHNKYRTRFMSEIFTLQANCGANLFATSRLIPDIIDMFKNDTLLEIRASDEDVRRYLDNHMVRLSRCVSKSPDLQEKIKVGIAKTVDGMFLLVQLYLDSLIDKTTPRAITRALEKLPTGSDALDLAYRKAIERIQGQETGFKELAWRIISWITCAKRPLTNIELQHALAVEVGDTELDEDNLQDIEEMVSLCAGLVTVDKESNIIRLVHYTTQQYFERMQQHWFPDAETEITKTCVTYLLFDSFNTGTCATSEQYKARLLEYPVYGYAARNWGHHARQASTSVEELILILLKSEAKLSASTQARLAFYEFISFRQQIPTNIHVAAEFGLEKAMVALLKNTHDLDVQDSQGKTPLMWAAHYEHEAVLRILLNKGAKLESKDKWDMTPLQQAAECGHEGIVRLLLEKGAKLESKNVRGKTPLLGAAESGHEAVVRLLLEKGAKLESEDTSGGTPLMWAANNGHQPVVRLLLEKGAKLESKNITGRTPLLGAAERGHEAVVRLLLEKGAKLESKDMRDRTPLSWAAEDGHERVVQLLLEKGADPNIKDMKGRTPLSWAAEDGNEGVVQLLVEKGADPNAKDNKGMTPLSWAIEKGHRAIENQLREKGAITLSLRIKRVR